MNHTILVPKQSGLKFSWPSLPMVAPSDHQFKVIIHAVGSPLKQCSRILELE
jgi:hypothetical protein